MRAATWSVHSQPSSKILSPWIKQTNQNGIWNQPFWMYINTSKCKGSNFDLESNRTYSHLSAGDFGPVLLWRWTSLLKLARHLSNLAAVLQKQLLFQVVLDTTLVDGLSAMLQLSKRRNGQCLKSNDLNLSILSILSYTYLLKIVFWPWATLLFSAPSAFLPSRRTHSSHQRRHIWLYEDHGRTMKRTALLGNGRKFC